MLEYSFLGKPRVHAYKAFSLFFSSYLLKKNLIVEVQQYI